jgi:hypothetical protein
MKLGAMSLTIDTNDEEHANSLVEGPSELRRSSPSSEVSGAEEGRDEILNRHK